MKVYLRGVELHYEIQGTGLPVILIHGYPLSQKIWAPQVEALRAEFCVITPDVRGHGESAATRGIYTMDILADDILTLMQHLQCGPAVLAGHSMGGYIALAFWRKYPEWMKGLVLVSTRAAADSVEGRAGREALAQAVEKEKSAVPVLAKMLPHMLAPASLTANAHLKTEVEGIMSHTSQQGLAGALRGMAMRADVQESLAAMRIPVLIVAGTADALIPYAESEKMARAIPGAELRLIEGAGHLPSLEKPDELNPMLQAWLRKIGRLAG